MRDVDVGERRVDLTGSDSSPVLQTQPGYFGLLIALAYASLSAHSIEPCRVIGFLLALSSAMSFLSLS
jgi:hypothetical protein